MFDNPEVTNTNKKAKELRLLVPFFADSQICECRFTDTLLAGFIPNGVECFA